MANKKYKLTDGNYWATDGVYDLGQSKTQRTINSDVQTALGGKAPTDHSKNDTTYGKGTDTKYGHVKISDSLTDTTTAATGGIVPSMKAVSDLNGAINDVIEVSTNNTQSADNKLWIDESADSQIQVPTWAEFQALETELSELSSGLIAKGLNIADGTLDQTVCYKIGNVICVGGRIHSMTNQIANGDFFRIPSGFWPSIQVRCLGYVYITEQSQFTPAIATISSNNGYVNISVSNSVHVSQVAFYATYPIPY